MARCTAYLQIEPEFWQNWDGPRLRNIHAVRMTQKQPREPIGGTITVKLNLNIPDSAFLPLEPEATIEVSERDVQVNVAVEEAA